MGFEVSPGVPAVRTTILKGFDVGPLINVIKHIHSDRACALIDLATPVHKSTK